MRSSVWPADAVVVVISSVTLRLCLVAPPLCVNLKVLTGRSSDFSVSSLSPPPRGVFPCESGTALVPPGPRPSQQTLAEEPASGAWSSAAAHAFPCEPMTTCWPLKTERTSLKIDKLCLACTEPAGVLQSGTDGFTGISCGTDLIQQAADYNPDVQRATPTFVSWVWWFYHHQDV